MAVASTTVVELIPVVELPIAPFMERSDLPSPPTGGGLEDWAAWREERRIALGLRADDFLTGSYLILDALVTDRLLDLMIDVATARAGEYGFDAMYGGVVLRVNGRIVAAPECCVNLCDGLVDWFRLVDDRPERWTSIWTGHPLILARVVDSTVQFSEQADQPAEVVVAEAPLGPLRDAVAQLAPDCWRLSERLQLRLDQRGIPDSETVAQILAGLAKLRL